MGFLLDFFHRRHRRRDFSTSTSTGFDCMNASDSPKPSDSAFSQVHGEKSAIMGGIAKPKKQIKQRRGNSDNPRRSQRNSQSVELFALFDPYGNASKHAASYDMSQSKTLCDDNEDQFTDPQNLSPILSINGGDDHGYQTPSLSPDDDSQNSDSQHMSVSPQHDESSEMDTHQLYETPRAPLIRPIASPLDNFDFGLDLCYHRSRVDNTFNHLKLCFNNEMDAAFSPPEQPLAAAASAQATPKRNEKNMCLMQ